MKKFLSFLTMLLTCLTLSVSALAAGPYTYVTGPYTGPYTYAYVSGPWTANASYVVRPWESNYVYAPSANTGYVYTWNAGARGLSNFQRVKTYSSGTYKDVPAGAWYETGVKTLYETGVAGDGAYFRPSDGLTLGEVVSLAVRVHCVYNGWTVPVGMTELQYALNMGIVTAGQYDNYGDPASRRSFAAIMSKALPTEALRGINVVMDGAIPDVPSYDPGAWGIYTLYRAGVLVGSDGWGNFCPNDRITRASAAVITARMLDTSQRRSASVFTTYAGSISLDQTSIALYPAQRRTLTAYVYPANAVSRSVRWASSDYSVASVDAYGTVTALRPGTAVISASTASGATATCAVRVVSVY